VTVVDDAGRPIVGAEVINYGHPRTEFQQTQTDESGRASLTKLLPPFRGVNPELTFRAQGFAPKGVKLSPSQDGPAKITVSMEKGHHFRGRVVNGAGEPISGATVFTMDGNRGGYNGHQMMLAVDRNGRFSSTTAVPESSLFLEADGYTGLRQQKVVLDQEEEQVFTLDGLGRFRGVVVDATTRTPLSAASSSTPPPDSLSEHSECGWTSRAHQYRRGSCEEAAWLASGFDRGERSSTTPGGFCGRIFRITAPST
jgi:hypothetical protein